MLKEQDIAIVIKLFLKNNTKEKNVVKNGKSITGEQRYKCRALQCEKTFQLVHRYNACEKGVKKRMVDMALNGSGVRDTARVLSVAVSAVIKTLKKKRSI